ncbi:MAG: carboxy terminal-processing peptidase [Planctomycetales bacterium]
MKFRKPTRAAIALTVSMVLLAASAVAAQKLSTTTPQDEATAKLVAEMVERYHVSQGKIDDAVSEKTLKHLLEELDPQKLYFTQADVDALGKYGRQLDDLIKAGNVDFIYKLYDLHLERLKARIELANRLIDAEHDFTEDESLVLDGKDRAWARTDEEIADRWRKRIKYDLLILNVDGTPLAEARERLHRRYATVLHAAEQTDDGEKLETLLSAITHSFDPHSSYMSPRTLEDFRIQMELSLEGIGAALRSEDGYTTVAQIVPGGAAEKDGRLKVGDRIIGVDPGDGKLVDVVEMKLDKVVRYIRGKAGTIVRLQVKPAENGAIQIYDLTRQTIELKSAEVKGEIIDTKGRIPGRPGMRIGVIDIPSFYRDFRGEQQGKAEFKSTARDVIKVLRDFDRKGGVDAIVVDLRSNGGGALNEAIEVSGLFIDDGPVVQVKEQTGKIRSHDDLDEGVYYSGPLVVLCNRLSASASEIFAGAVRDYGRGIVVGDTTTHGKGTVQNVMPVSRQLFRFLDNNEDRGALKLTIQQFYRVNGESTQQRGVRSDVVLPSLIDHLELGEGYLENALAFSQIEPARFRPVNLVTKEAIYELQTASAKRVAAEAKFQEVEQDIQRYLERKNRKTITLHEEQYRAERKADKRDKEEDPAAEETADGPIFPADHYNDEVLQITLHYVDLLNGAKTARK